MNPKSGILVVNRFELMRRANKAGILPSRMPAIILPPDQIFQRYRGFDGQSWPETEGRSFSVDGGLADLTSWPLVSQYIEKCSLECDVIVLAHLGTDLHMIEQAGWVSAGFDVGSFESEWSHFSIVLNEVLFGIQPELRSFSGRMNEHLLVNTLDDALALLRERERLVKLGKDLEHGEQNEPIEVFLRRERLTLPH